VAKPADTGIASIEVCLLGLCKNAPEALTSFLNYALSAAPTSAMFPQRERKNRWLLRGATASAVRPPLASFTILLKLPDQHTVPTTSFEHIRNA
jgi:hypothetical protein